MAASSKYNGISLFIVPVLLFFITQRHNIPQRSLRTIETLLIGSGLTFIGFAFGTPKALTWMTYYFKRMIPALLHTGNYLRQPDSVRGIVGQYAAFANGLGLPLFALFTVSFLWVCYRVYQAYAAKSKKDDIQSGYLVVLLLSLFALDLPIMVSYNYPIRFFLPMMPIFAVFSAFFVERIHQQAPYRKLTTVILAGLVLYSFARNISVMLLFINDARIPASEFVKTLPAGTSLEHTYYPPTIPLDYFAREQNYPIYFRKAQDEPLPTGRYKFNAGEIGLVKRGTDYFVVDSFTNDKFKNSYTCADMQVECDFFKQLDTGQSSRYKLISEFSYSLPPWLPQIQIAFVNPTIRIYERIQ